MEILPTFLKMEVVAVRYFYYPNGQIQAIEQFKNNVRHGLCAQFSEDGTIVFNSRYEDGEEVHNEANSKLHYLLPLSKTCLSNL